jgi:hypothetical protein
MRRSGFEHLEDTKNCSYPASLSRQTKGPPIGINIDSFKGYKE